MTLGQRITQHRRKTRLTQEQAAEQIGISVRQYQNWETNKAKPSQANLEKIAAFYNTTPEKLQGIQLTPGLEERLNTIEKKLDRVIKHLGC